MEIYTPAAYHKPHPRWFPMIPTEETLKAYIEKLDLYIVSHGGVGSVYLTEYLESKGIKVGANRGYCIPQWQWSAHYPYQLSARTPTLYVYGDVKNSLISQYKNTLRIKYPWAKEDIEDALSRFSIKVPLDGFEIKRRQTDSSYVVTDPILSKVLSIYNDFPERRLLNDPS